MRGGGLLTGIISRLVNRGVVITSPHSIYISPLIKTALHSRGIHNGGILIGRILNSERNIFWNPNKSMSPHVIVVGPTGSGKTETLTSIATRMNMIFSVTVLMIDIKGDIASRLSRRGHRFHMIDISRTPLGSLYPFYVEPLTRAGQVFESIVSSYEITDMRIQASIYRALRGAFERKPLPTWGHVASEVAREEDSVRTMVFRIVDEISQLDGGRQAIGHYEIREREVNIVSLARISKEREEMLGYAMNMVFQDMINYMSARNIDPGRVRGALVIDEAWILSRHGRSAGRVLNLVKLSRGYGLSVLLATQSFRDLGDMWDRILENSGLLIVLNNPSNRFWRDASNFLKIDRGVIRDLMVVMGRGDAIIRILPDPRPIPVSLENEVEKTAELDL